MTISANAPSSRELAETPVALDDARVMESIANELEWLLEVSAGLTQTASWGPEAHRERLLGLLASAVQRLGCVLGALFVPARSLRLVRGTLEATQTRAEELSTPLEEPVVQWMRRKSEPMLVNRGRAAGSPPLRLLAAPVQTRGSQTSGALLLVRPIEAPRFTRVHLALAMHLARMLGTQLDADLDPATGLHTRQSLQDQLGSSKALAESAGDPHAILALKIDRLDAINKTSGLGVGDAVIAGVAGLLRALPERFGALAARISSNEFTVVLPHAKPETARQTAESLQRQSGKLLVDADGGQEPISLSCGIASMGSAREFESALALAQLACRTAMKRGAGRIEIYQDTDLSMIQRHTDIIAVQLLREALREDKLTLFAQRIVPLRETVDGGGYELLLRSPDDLADNRAPVHLLSAAHRNHLAPAVDLWVIEHALAEAAPYRTHLESEKISLAINISGPSLTEPKFLERIRAMIDRSRIAPSLITFEITETVAVLSLSKAVGFIRELRSIGCRFALDDFGTGVNSLKNLTSLPVDRVKIDGSFVSDLLTNRQSESMVRAIATLARDLGIGTVAEYAESAEIISRLGELGVDYAQGYGIGRPHPFAEALQSVQQQSSETLARGR